MPKHAITFAAAMGASLKAWMAEICYGDLATCPEDGGTSGDGVCEPGEESWCPQDCGWP